MSEIKNIKNLRYTLGEDRTLRASVSIILNDKEEILFIKRAERSGDPWSGHIGFPGGKTEAEDDNKPYQTAIRETVEEIGVLLEDRNFVKCLSPVIPEQKFHGIQLELWPILFRLPGKISLSLDSTEVERVLFFPVSYLLEENRIEHKNFELMNGMSKNLPYIKAPSGEIIWGLSFNILMKLRPFFLNNT